jgi:hypothetical protein
MRDPAVNTSAFPMAQCGECGKTVLTYVALDYSGEEARRCVHCDAPVAGALKWVSADELEASGYRLGYRPAQDGGGCGSGGCGSCSIRKNE